MTIGVYKSNKNAGYAIVGVNLLNLSKKYAKTQT